ncbi:MAG: hypothetical protein IJZ75_04480 [Clostridia bacterium]|nr:hypothetical protein [Clostridia bacterium]
MPRKIKALIIAVILILVLALTVFLVYPHIEFRKDGKLYVCRFNDDFSEFEENPSYNEIYFYNGERDISIKTFDVKSFLCFYLFTFEYIEGDARETQFILEEEFIEYWLKNAEITDNARNIDIATLIEGKEAIVSNTRYLGNEYNKAIYYKLDGEYGEMYVFESDGLTVIQVGSPDEQPRFIAYK